ncbi:nam-like protein 2 [Genlisea aurea]|uniref:Nam-like protein 2 n=1 Tax=Genlisea aurea TaxID=192259 RepID=S8E9C0_9LAMI|nr:nam-like protein 2 [Genlisea aurea]
MGKASIPPGFRFHPTDIELIMYYLKRKVTGRKFHFEAISEVNIYKFSPWDLPDMSCLKSKDLEWFFFCPREKKYASGTRVKRATKNGYWKTTGKDRPISYNAAIVGTVKTLVFHMGNAPRGERTDWVIHEYRILDKHLAASGLEDAYVLCKLFKKSGPGPKNGAQYGAPFVEADWSDQEIDDAVNNSTSSALLPENQFSNATVLSDHGIPSSSADHGKASRGEDDDDVIRMLSQFNDETMCSEDAGINQGDLAAVKGKIPLDSCDGFFNIFEGLGDLDNNPTASPPNEGTPLDLFSSLYHQTTDSVFPDDSSYIELDDLLVAFPCSAEGTKASHPSADEVLRCSNCSNRYET